MKSILYWVRHVEPVAVATFVSAVFALYYAVQSGNVTEGVVTAFVIALAGLFARSQVSPVGPAIDDGEYEE